MLKRTEASKAREREIWRLHDAGHSIMTIAGMIGVGRRIVEIAIDNKPIPGLHGTGADGAYLFRAWDAGGSVVVVERGSKRIVDEPGPGA